MWKWVRMGGGISFYVGQYYKFAFLSGISVMSEVIEIWNVEVTNGNEFICVIGIHHLPDKAKLSHFNEILRVVLKSFDSKYRIWFSDDFI